MVVLTAAPACDGDPPTPPPPPSLALRAAQILEDGEVVRPEPLLVNDDWQHAPVTTYFGEGEAIRLEPGQGLSIRSQYDYSCEEHLDNTPGTSCPPTLRGGPEAASEMCSLKTWYRGPVVRDVDSGEPRCF